ncbi:MAG: PilT/PilU family type 4a pilus ATPase [Planctomycetota bacterium]
MQKKGKGSEQDRRTARRLERAHVVKAIGDHGIYSAVLGNLSFEGALLTITDEAFGSSDFNGSITKYARRVTNEFANGVKVRFMESDVRVQASVVRIDETSETPAIGLRFQRPLNPAECKTLDIPSPVDQDDPRWDSKAEVSKYDGAYILKLMDEMRNHRATDLHIKVGSPPRIRVDGELLDVDKDLLDELTVEAMVHALLSTDQTDMFDQVGDLDLACSIDGSGRFRINVMRQRGLPGLAIRRIPEDVPSLKALDLTPHCITLAERPRGLVLVTGPTGSGKSTTLAAMIKHINQTRRCHILTMEDPIEYLHADIKAHVTQREIGKDTPDFASSLRRALRQDPDVILVGEMRDLETIALAITAAETGHLVFATLHTTSAPLTVDRIIDVFPPNQQAQIRMQLADCLQGVLSQMLLPKASGGVVCVQEVLVATDAVRALIREGKAHQISNFMQTGGKSGMQTLESVLNDLVARRKVTYQMAVSKANHPAHIRRGGERMHKHAPAVV